MGTVVYVTLDGVRPDALDQADCTSINSVRARGAYQMAAESLMPTSTLPCHMSIFHSVPAERHGVTINTYTPMVKPIPSLFELVYQAKKRSAMFYCWEPLRDLGRPGHLDFSYFNTSGENTIINWDIDHDLARKANEYIRQEAPDFVFLYFGTVDVAGHQYGWMEDGYLRQLEHIDNAFGEFLDGLPSDTTLLIQSDHGGHDRDHGTDLPEDILIPWIIAGPMIKENYAIESPVSLLDTAPTLARCLNLLPHDRWEGKVVEEIFTTP